MEYVLPAFSQFGVNFDSMLFEGMFCKISSGQNNDGRSLCNRILNLSGALIFWYGWLISTALKSSGSWRKKNRIRKKKKRQFPEIQNVNQTVAFLWNYSAALSFTSASIICSSRSISGNTTFLPLEWSWRIFFIRVVTSLWMECLTGTGLLFQVCIWSR